MIHLYPQRGDIRHVVCLVAAMLFAIGAAGQARVPSGEATLYGTIRDEQAKPIASARVYLVRDGSEELKTQTDEQGKYRFAALKEGVYTLRAEGVGYAEVTIRSCFVAAGETKNLDLRVQGTRASAESGRQADGAKFYDQPEFTVSGVTDTTSLGGHGSDAIVRTRDSLTKETAELTKSPPASNGDSSGASEELLRARVKRDPDSFEVNSELGTILVEEGKSSEAIQYLEQAAKLDPKGYRNRFELALAYFNTEDFARSRDTAQSLLGEQENPQLHHLLAGDEEKLGDSLGAVHDYQRAAELEPSEGNLFDWGAELLLHHAPEPAMEVFTKGAKLFPRSGRMLIGIGATEFARGSYDAAVERICQASDLNPEDPTAYRFLGTMQRAEGSDAKEVRERLHRFVTLHPDSADANYFYAVAIRNEGKNSGKEGGASAEALLKNAIRLDPKLGPAHLQLGILYVDEKELGQAIVELQKATKISSDVNDRKAAHYQLARAYREAGREDEAKAESQLYQQMARESEQQSDRERHEIQQFVYTLREQAPARSQ